MVTILIADDELIECRTLERMIACRYNDIAILPSVNDGISLMKSMEAHHPDILIVDINMPALSGLEAIELMRTHELNSKIIVNTAYSDFDFAQRAIRCGACDYVLKPDKETLLRAVDNAYRKTTAQKQQQSIQREQHRQKHVWNAVLEREIMNALIIGEIDAHSFSLLRKENPSIGKVSAMVALIPEGRDPAFWACHEPLHQGLSRMLRDTCFFLEREYRGGLYLLIMTPADGQKDEKLYIQDTVELLAKWLRNRGKICIGVSRVKDGDEQLSDAFWECRRACSDGKSGVHVFESPKKTIQSENLSVNLPDLSELGVDMRKVVKNTHVRKAVAYIRRNYMKDISLEDVSKECGLNPFYMSRIFRQTLDVSFVTLLTGIRLERAVELLREGEMTNREIAETVGYTSSSYFHKVFRQKAGMSINEYRVAIGVKAGGEEGSEV